LIIKIFDKIVSMKWFDDVEFHLKSIPVLSYSVLKIC
jgi:hypothetical protein